MVVYELPLYKCYEYEKLEKINTNYQIRYFKQKTGLISLTVPLKQNIINSERVKKKQAARIKVGSIFMKKLKELYHRSLW